MQNLLNSPVEDEFHTMSSSVANDDFIKEIKKYMFVNGLENFNLLFIMGFKFEDANGTLIQPEILFEAYKKIHFQPVDGNPDDETFYYLAESNNLNVNIRKLQREIKNHGNVLSPTLKALTIHETLRTSKYTDKKVLNGEVNEYFVSSSIGKAFELLDDNFISIWGSAKNLECKKLSSTFQSLNWKEREKSLQIMEEAAESLTGMHFHIESLKKYSVRFESAYMPQRYGSDCDKGFLKALRYHANNPQNN